MSVVTTFGTIKDETGMLGVDAIIEAINHQVITEFFSQDGQQINLKDNNSDLTWQINADQSSIQNIDMITIQTGGAVEIESVQASACSVTVVDAGINIQGVLDVSNVAYAANADGSSISLISSGIIQRGSLYANGGGNYVAKNLIDHLIYGGINGQDSCFGGNKTMHNAFLSFGDQNNQLATNSPCVSVFLKKL